MAPSIFVVIWQMVVIIWQKPQRTKIHIFIHTIRILKLDEVALDVYISGWLANSWTILVSLLWKSEHFPTHSYPSPYNMSKATMPEHNILSVVWQLLYKTKEKDSLFINESKISSDQTHYTIIYGVIYPCGRPDNMSRERQGVRCNYAEIFLPFNILQKYIVHVIIHNCN